MVLLAFNISSHAGQHDLIKKILWQKNLTLKDFSTDGCSAYPDGYVHTQEYEWLHCCFAHDIKYWVGGTKKEKLAADDELNQCVSEATFNAHGKMMELGVLAGGIPQLPTSWRWGYGWNRLVGYDVLTEEQLVQVDKQFFTVLNELTINSQYLNDEQIDYILEEYQKVRKASEGARFKESPPKRIHKRRKRADIIEF